MNKQTFLVFITILIAILLMTLTITSVNAQDVTPTSIIQNTLTPTPISEKEIPNSNVEVLNAQLELMKEHTQQLLETIYWAFGILITVILFVAGAGWYVNFRLYERDKDAIKKDLELMLEEKSINVQKNLEKITNERLQQIEKSATRAGETAAHKLNHHFESLKSELLSLRYNMLEKDAESWRNQGVLGNEMTAYLEMGKTAKELGWEWRTSRALDGLESVFKRGAKADSEEIRELTNFLNSLGDEYAIQANKIKELISKA